MRSPTAIRTSARTLLALVLSLTLFGCASAPATLGSCPAQNDEQARASASPSKPCAATTPGAAVPAPVH
jgi:hypothetical protein